MEIHELTNDEIPAEFRNYPQVDVEGWTARFRAWLKESNTYYYARPRESFRLHEAYALAECWGCTNLLLEDMS